MKPRRAGRPRNSELAQRDQHILQVAGETFLHAGFDGTTMDAVAETARISKRTLYARYEDKTALFKAVLSDLIARWLVPIDRFQCGSAGLTETLLELARYLTTFALTPQSIGVTRIIIAEAERQPEFGRLALETGRKPAVRVIASILRRHREELRPLDLNRAAEQFMNLAIDGHLQLACLGVRSSRQQIERQAQAAVALFLAGTRR
ncbi:MAG TPA: TetR/AcrR family transcriptional regulator C-terminal domain-containing protein [Hypericibacter adhaerens]|jgi:AcrR family transcriptional regulator|nr:TetR/AcrR family transcriptional regulator C-terminal domain-containing protein [Hypericibacter adhaerens]HWA42541.1 TetR/AcrR family transcriptional regulator C-terminal domain-containing protein [Hypericibacter adhaerens]